MDPISLQPRNEEAGKLAKDGGRLSQTDIDITCDEAERFIILKSALTKKRTQDNTQI